MTLVVRCLILMSFLISFYLFYSIVFWLSLGQCFAQGLYDISLYLESGYAFWQEWYSCEVIFPAYHIRRHTK